MEAHLLGRHQQGVGPGHRRFAFTDAGNGKVLTVTYWITKKDQEKHFPTIEKIFESVKRTGS